MCTAVILAVLANLKVLDNVNIVSENTAFQHELSELLESYNEADIQANVLYEILDDEANGLFAKHTAVTQQSFQAIIEHIDAYPMYERFRPQIQDSYTRFTDWKAAVDEMILRNNELEQCRSKFSDNGSQLSEGLAVFMNYQTANEGQKDQMVLAYKVSDAITAFRLSSLTFQHTFDISFMDQSVKKMDEATALLEQYRRGASSAGGSQAAQKLIDVIKRRQELSAEFATANDASDAARDLAIPNGIAATQAIDIAVHDVYDGIEERSI